jgi:IS605 OrfB family transposase
MASSCIKIVELSIAREGPMKRRPGPPTKTFRFRLHHRPQEEAWFEGTARLFNQVAAFYFDVLQAHPGILDLSDKEALSALERLTHATRGNPGPLLPLSGVADSFPAMARRAAIHAALGAARSFQSNLEGWRQRKERAEEKARRKGQRCAFHERPPVPPRQWNKSVVLYKGMYRALGDDAVLLKVWTGQAWVWARFGLWGRAIPADWKAGSPQVVRRRKGWGLHVPATKEGFVYPAKVEKQLEEPHTRLCAVDLNINDALAVCAVQEADGTVVATRFIRGGQELQGRRKRALGRVAVKRSQTGVIGAFQEDNARLFRYIRAIDEDTAHRVSRRIVEFAQEHGATIIVLEHLGRFRPQKGRYSARGNEKRSYWLRGRIFRYTRYKAWEEGIVTCRVNPHDTSRRCACCGGWVGRHSADEAPVAYRPGAPLFTCPACQQRGNADRNASINIGHRLLERYGLYEKPAPRGTGVSRSQDAGNGDGPHSPPERHGARDGPGTARTEGGSAVRPPSSVPCLLRPPTSGGYAASTPETAHAGAHKEAPRL